MNSVTFNGKEYCKFRSVTGGYILTYIDNPISEEILIIPKKNGIIYHEMFNRKTLEREGIKLRFWYV